MRKNKRQEKNAMFNRNYDCSRKERKTKRNDYGERVIQHDAANQTFLDVYQKAFRTIIT